MVIDLTPEQVAMRLEAGEIILIDVREPHEYQNERIPGALLHALSTFEPAALPVDSKREVVLHCAAGGRSARAVEACQAAGLPVNAHLAGGIGAWTEAGLPVDRIDAATGRMVRSG